MLLNTPISSVTERFDRATFTLMRILGAQILHTSDLPITKTQFYMLSFIHQHSPCKTSFLADKLEVNNSAITVMLDRLEDQRLIHRHRNDNDRRVIQIELTDTGIEILQQGLTVRKNILERYFSQLSEIEVTTLITTLEKLSSIAANDHRDKTNERKE